MFMCLDYSWDLNYFIITSIVLQILYIFSTVLIFFTHMEHASSDIRMNLLQNFILLFKFHTITIYLCSVG